MKVKRLPHIRLDATFLLEIGQWEVNMGSHEEISCVPKIQQIE